MTPGTLIAGRYRLLRPIGAGGMGTVWAARHEVLARDVAIKVAIAEGTSDDARTRFLREARIVGRLRHPNVVDVADAGELDGGGLYLAMELLQGESLAERLAASGAIPVVDALALALAVGRGLEAAHAAGVVHRDVKPANVFLARTAAGVVPKLLDFGVGKFVERTIDAPTLSGTVCATPAYMSPEQALGEDPDARTDVWSLGVVLYEMISGGQPFVAESYPALLPMIAEDAHPPLVGVPAGVALLVDRCLEKTPAARFADAAALCRGLEEQLDALGVAPTAVVTNEGVPSSRLGSQVSVLEARPAPRRRGRALAVAAAIVLGGAAIALTTARTAAPTAAAASTTTSAVAVTSAVAASTTASAPAVEAPPPSASPTSEPASAAAAPPSTAASAGVTPPRRPPAAPRGGAARPVTRVDNAGF